MASERFPGRIAVEGTVERWWAIVAAQESCEDALDGGACRYVRVDAFDAARTERDALAAENARLRERVKRLEEDRDVLLRALPEEP